MPLRKYLMCGSMNKVGLDDPGRKRGGPDYMGQRHILKWVTFDALPLHVRHCPYLCTIAALRGAETLDIPTCTLKILAEREKCRYVLCMFAVLESHQQQAITSTDSIFNALLEF
jgi:hypothetical protein